MWCFILVKLLSSNKEGVKKKEKDENQTKTKVFSKR